MRSDEATLTSPTVAEIAVDGARAGGDATLSYAVPEALAESLAVGQLVWVPLRKQTVLGIVVRLHGDLPSYPLREIVAAVEPAFVLDPGQMRTIAWLAREAACDLYAAASLFLPPGAQHRTVAVLHLAADVDGGLTLTAAQQRLVALLRERGEQTLEAAQKALGSSLSAVVPALESLGVIRRSVRVVDATPASSRVRYVRLAMPDADVGERAPRQRAVVEELRRSGGDAEGWVVASDVIARAGADGAALAALVRKGIVAEEWRRLNRREPAPPSPAPSLTPAQAAVWAEVERRLQASDPTPLLLHGVTGSGKTEIYLRAVAWCLRQGRSAIVLVPEIGLASQILRRFESRFPDRVAVSHSALRDSERYETWQAIAAGERMVVVGPRSALAAPAMRLGLIVVDEEHESAYKQETDPRYHARALAERIAAERGAVLLLGSATPSVETFTRAQRGEIGMLSLPERVPDAGGTALALPPVEVVDMRLELQRGGGVILSNPLRQLITRALEQRSQAMLLLNRRGTSTVVICRACGTALQCPQCEIPLVFHSDRARLVCHRCNYQERPRTACPECDGELLYQGVGTQRVEQEVQRHFPQAKVLRWDQDAVQKAGGHERLLMAVEQGDVDIVVGTQMIAKGLDLPRVTAIGVIHADAQLHLPDFRSAERTFQLLTQVAGRAGRRSAGSGVIVQSYSPGHYAIQAAAHHDYQAFYGEEIGFRRVHRYPPFARLARFAYRHADEERCIAEADELARLLSRHARSCDVRADLIGPAPAFVSKIRGEFQWQMVLRSDPEEFERLLDGLPRRPGWLVDIDPQSLL